MLAGLISSLITIKSGTDDDHTPSRESHEFVSVVAYCTSYKGGGGGVVTER